MITIRRAIVILGILAITARASDEYHPNDLRNHYPDADSSLKIQTSHSISKAVQNVLSRLPKWISAEFTAIRVARSSEITEGHASLIGSASGVEVEASSAVDALYAIHSYLREFCGTMVSWEGENMPEIGKCQRPEEFERSFKSPTVRFFGNSCTFSYSFAWWDWTQWERFIDWLALSGFNIALAPVGQEAIWADLWRELGVSQKGLDDFFPGPAFLAWHRMGNVQALGGSMTPEYLDSQLNLNKKIVRRMVEIGIVPVLPTFAGFVPQEFERKRKDLRFLHNKCWNGLNETYSCTSSLHPQEPLFKEIAKMFIEKQTEIYGHVTDVYSADPFNESPPEQLSEADVAQMSHSIFKGCVMGNSRCVWLLQSWTFAWKKSAVKEFLTQVPKGRLIVLDLHADKRPLYKELDSFYGHYFVWCLLQNFGGNTQMRGNLDNLHKNYRSAISTEDSMVGMGLTMEGINQNYVVYQYFIDLSWSEQELDPRTWIWSYAAARYGSESPLQTLAWNMLHSTFYSQVDFKNPLPFDFDDDESNEHDERREIFLYLRPKFLQRIRYWFPEAMIEKLGTTFSLLNITLGSNKLQDYADVMREVIQNKLSERIQYAQNGYWLLDREMMKKGCTDVENLFIILDQNEVHDLSEWILMARAAARPKSEADVFERQARNQLTLWGPNGEISDYARKEWGGLIRKFYAKRWALFCDVIQTGNRFDQKKFEEQLMKEVEQPFAHL